MKKTLLALAITALSANAFALELGKDSAEKFASEIKLAAAGTALTLSEAVDVKTGFSITTGNVRYVRFDITGAEFDVTKVVAADLQNDDDAVETVVSAVDANNKQFVIFEITATVDVANDDVLKFTPRILAKTGSNVSLQYRLYETGVAALAGNNDVLATKTGSVITFAPALSFTVVPEVNVEKIDVTQESKFFAGNFEEDEAVLGTVSVNVATGVQWASGAQATIADLVSNEADANAIVINGDFSSAAKITLDGETADATNENLTATSATFALADAAAVGALNGAIVTFVTNGTDAIAPSSFTATLDVTPAATATAATGSTATDLSGALASLVKNGSTDEVDLALKPGGAYSNFVRISNTSGLEGKIFVTVIADDGQTATVALNEIAGQPATLAPRASTTQMTIQQVFDAAAAKGLSLSGEGKLRLVVEGEVPSLSVQTYTVSKDGNSFATF